MGMHDSERIKDLLGLGVDGALLDEACLRWARWAQLDRRLVRWDGPETLLIDLRGAIDAGDEQLLALAELAAIDGGDDLAAAAVLALALVPGTVMMASRLTASLARRGWRPPGINAEEPLSRWVNELVAAHLWIEVRSFPWRRLTRVGGNILMNTRAHVLRECGDHCQVERFELTWARTVPVDVQAARGGFEALWPSSDEGVPGYERPWFERDAEDRLADVLQWAETNNVLAPADLDLVCALVEAAGQTETRQTSRGRGNLCSDRLAEIVAPRLGVHPSTVRRRAAKAIQTLAATAPDVFRCA